jgi:hypothetical protein
MDEDCNIKNDEFGSLKEEDNDDDDEGAPGDNFTLMTREHANTM